MTDRARSRGVLFVVSAPSGTGKTTIALETVRRVLGLEFSVSYTTRERRSGERDGVEYHFVDAQTFGAMIERDAFLEWADVFGRRYGTGREATEARLAAGEDVLLEIDVQGAAQVRDAVPEAVTVFVLPPDHATQRARLVARGRERGEEVHRRLARARAEAAEYVHYDYVVVNRDLDEAIEDVVAIVRAERRRARRVRGQAESILATYPSGEAEGGHAGTTGDRTI